MADRDDQGSKNEFFGDSKEDRSAAYRAWRRHLGDGMYVLDVDQVEWRHIDGQMVPVATIELTRRDDPGIVDDVYLETIVDRYKEEFQGFHSIYIAMKLAVFAYLVVYREDLSMYWIYNMSLDKGWRMKTQEEYEEWIRNLSPPAAENMLKLVP
jgi:hypothetical protein